MKKSLVLLIILSLVLASCASMKVPIPEDDQATQLVVRVKTETVDQFGFFASYKVLLDNGGSFLITPAEGYAHIKSLTPGSYRITGRQAYYKDTGKYGSNVDLNIPFTLEPGTITILPEMIQISIRHGEEEGQYTQSFNTVKMGSIHREDAVDYLSGFENIGHWNIQN